MFKTTKPGDLINAHKALAMGKKAKKKSKKGTKKKFSVGGLMNNAKTGAKMIGNMGKAFARNATGGDVKAILGKNKKRTKKK